MSPADIRSPLVIYFVLAAEALFDGASWVLALRAFRSAKGNLGYRQAMTSSKDPPSFIVLAGDTAGLVGIAVAASGTLLATSFNLPAADGIASIVVRMVLAVVGWVLVREKQGTAYWRTSWQRTVAIDSCLGQGARRGRRRKWRHCRAPPAGMLARTSLKPFHKSSSCGDQGVGSGGVSSFVAWRTVRNSYQSAFRMPTEAASPRPSTQVKYHMDVSSVQ
jgi:hypothetical protein